jgi:hypothetical protein
MIKNSHKKKLQKEFRSSHGLIFEVGGPFRWDEDFTHFRVGTVTGIWAAYDNSYVLLAIINEKPGNGNFTDLLEWFERSCKRDGYSLKIIEIVNEKFMIHLINRRGFKKTSENSVEKIFSHNTNQKNDRGPGKDGSPRSQTSR